MKFVLSVCVLWECYLLSAGYPQDTSTNSEPPVRTGRYVPELFRADRGKYIPDDSGKYTHIKIPYDGGYGDRGEKYVHNAPAYIHQQDSNKFPLDQRDHLRFMIDFNYDGTGWQLLQFEWARDGDSTRRYNYVNENGFGDMGNMEQVSEGPNESAYEEAGSESAAENPSDSETVVENANTNTNVRVSGEYGSNIYNVSYSNDNRENGPSQSNVQNAIREVLDYIQTYVLPTLH